jgi:hypothetical protein
VKVKLTARLDVCLSQRSGSWLFYFVRIRRRNSAGGQGCLLYLALMLDDDRDSELYINTVT